MKKINFGFKKQKNNDALIKRNWKKIWIWTSVVLVLIAGIIPAIYFPVVNNKSDNAGEPIPTSLNKADVDEAVSQAKSVENTEQVWGLYIDIEENEKSDFAIYGAEEDVDGDEEYEFNKDEFKGPFSEHSKNSNYEWLTFWDQTTEDATDMLAEFIWKINEDKAVEEGIEVQEQYFEISMLDGNVDWETIKNQDTNATMSVTKLDKNPETGEEEDYYEIEFGTDGTTSTSVDGPMWLTFKGDDLVFVVKDISTTIDEGSITSEGDFDELMYWTSQYKFNEDEETPITNENK